MRFIPGDIVQHPDLVLVGQVLTCELEEESYLIIDFSTGTTRSFYDTDEQLVHYTDSDFGNPLIFVGNIPG